MNGLEGLGDLWAETSPDTQLFEQLKKIGLYVGVAFAIWYFVKRERI